MTQIKTSRQRKRRDLFALGSRSGIVAALAAVLAMTIPAGTASAQYDFEASGFLVPAGMAPPSMPPGGVAPVGYHAECDSGCDGSGGCTSCGGIGFGGGMGGCGLGGCGTGCGPLGCGGLFGTLRGARCGGGIVGGFADLCHLCGGVPMTLGCLLPYSEAGCCAPRWYDLSVEAAFLGHNRVGPTGTLTTLGVAPGGEPVLDLASVGSADLEGGVRVSGALILGPGGNLELTYLGGHEWEEGASVFDAGAGLFSFVSEFGTNPGGSPAGFDDTDRSLRQSVEASSRFHSGELNYRRRTVGPNCVLQGSWLVGLRYLRFDHDLLYSALGENNNTVNNNLPRFFSSDDQVDNNLFGVQIGGDLWWNLFPGISLGTGVKGAWLQNDIDRRTALTANSIVVGQPGTIAVESGEQDGTVAAEFTTALIYRLSHSWSFRTSYYALAIDEVAVGTTDLDTIRDFVQVSPVEEPALTYDSVVIQGVTFGAEYLW